MPTTIDDTPTTRIAPRQAPAPTRRRTRPALFASVLLLLAAASAYLVAVIALRLDHLVLPGNELALPGAFQVVPGLSAEGSSGSALTERINILVLGLDRRPSEGSEPTRSDSMFVVTLDPATKTGGVLSIPRDLWVELPDGQGGYFEDRINTAYRYGGTANYRGGPLQAAHDAVQHNFPQIRIDYEIAIDFSSFIKMIDTLGGIDIQVTEAFQYTERVSVDDRNGVLPSFKVGTEHMNGERALYYSRYRGGIDGDLGRIRRQQQVMLAVANKVISLDAFGRAPELWSRFKDSVDTDVPSFRVPGIALLAKQVGLDKVTMRSLGEVTQEVITDGGADVLVADPADMARIIGDIFYDPKLRQESAVIEVQNATTRAGLATATAGYLIQRGLRPTAVTVTTATTGPQDETVILSYGGKDYSAQRLAEWLGLPASRIRVVREPRPAGGPDLLVILGRDAKMPSAPTTGATAR
jgi:polyisoprenyl-teichoic acid--peptidoglycan teichoic acid transferase